MREDSLLPEAIVHNLSTRFMGRKILYYPRLTSTMEVARQEAKRGASEGTVVIAEEQTAGQGRMNRTWISPAGSIALSIILHPAITYLPYLIMLASLAVVHSIESVTNLKPVIKWPNDILVGDKKVSGILIESKVRGNSVDYAVIGIGINVNFSPADFPEILPIATSLADELGIKVSRLAITQRLLIAMERLYLSLPDSVYEEWRDRLITLGRRVSVKWGETTHEGIAESVTKDGNLLLRQDDGAIIKIVAGDILLHN